MKLVFVLITIVFWELAMPTELALKEGENNKRLPFGTSCDVTYNGRESKVKCNPPLLSDGDIVLQMDGSHLYIDFQKVNITIGKLSDEKITHKKIRLTDETKLAGKGGFADKKRLPHNRVLTDNGLNSNDGLLDKAAVVHNAGGLLDDGGFRFASAPVSYFSRTSIILLCFTLSDLFFILLVITSILNKIQKPREKVLVWYDVSAELFNTRVKQFERFLKDNSMCATVRTRKRLTKIYIDNLAEKPSKKTNLMQKLRRGQVETIKIFVCDDGKFLPLLRSVFEQ